MVKHLLARLPKARLLPVACWLVLVCAAADSNLLAQRPSSPRHSLAVDEVTLTTGKRMYGIVMQSDAATGVTLAVERDWFESTYPAVYVEKRKTEVEAAKVAGATQLKRLKAWKTNRATDDGLVTFIDEEITRTVERQNDAEQADQPKLTQFMLIAYPAAEIKEVFIQPASQHHIAGCAWKHQVKRVSTRTSAALTRDLKKLQVDIENETVDLSSQLPVQPTQSEEEWAARVALFEYVLRKPLDFQGMGNNLLRVDSDKPPKLEDVLPQLLSGGMGLGLGQQGQGGLLDELLKELDLAGAIGRGSRAENKWWEPATKTAESEGFRGVRITRVVQNISSPLAKVEDYFFAQLKPGAWEPVITVAATADRNQVNSGDLVHLKQDPQIKQVLTLFDGLGLGSDALIETAIRQGAATEIAMKHSAAEFFEVLDRFTQHTDGPPLAVK